MRRFRRCLPAILILLIPMLSKAQGSTEFLAKAPPSSHQVQKLALRSNILPWALTIPNIGAEYTIGRKWSVVMDVMFCPWKISDRFSIKTVAILPEGRWWVKTNDKGSFFNLHLNLAWFNVRANRYRYQDTGRPLLGAGIGYGYRLPLKNHRWAFEFELGLGMANARYDRFYNEENGALKDTRVSTYWGVDRAAIAVTYYLCDL